MARRQDFGALGRILWAMLRPATDGTGAESAPDTTDHRTISAPRLPERLAALQALLDRLYGAGALPAFVDGAEVILELLRVRERFPFDGSAFVHRQAVRAAL